MGDSIHTCIYYSIYYWCNLNWDFWIIDYIFKLKTLILISALLFSFNILADNESELIEEGGILYKEFPNQLFDGSLILFHDDGAIKDKLIYKDGLKEGSRETFHKNGQLFEKETYKNGKLESIFQGYYDNGKLWWEGYAIDNLRHGEIKAFNKTGTLKYKGHYRDNLKQGLWKYFDENGEINNQECYQNNEITELSECGI